MSQYEESGASQNMIDQWSIFYNEWLVAAALCVCGVLSTIHIFLQGASWVWVASAIIEVSLFFILLMFGGLRRNRVFNSALLSGVLGAEFVGSLLRHAGDSFLRTAFWGAALVGSILALLLQIRDRKELQGALFESHENITRLGLDK